MIDEQRDTGARGDRGWQAFQSASSTEDLTTATLVTDG